MEDVVYTTRLYRLYGTHGIKVEPVELSPGSLDPNYVFVCDAGLKIYVWAGSKVCWSVFLECFSFFADTVYPVNWDSQRRTEQKLSSFYSTYIIKDFKFFISICLFQICVQ